MLTKLNTILSENLNNELCPYDSEEGSIASYYDDAHNINYIIFSLKEENIQDDPPFLVKKIINLDINNDDSPELCFVVHLQSGDTSSLDRFPITLGEGRGASIELYDTSGSQIDFFAPRKMTFLYAFDGSVIKEYLDIRDGYGIKINDGAFVSLDINSTVFTIACPLQWSFNIFPNDITTGAPIFFVGSLSDWCGGTQDFSLFYDTYIANEALHPISSYIGISLFGGLEFCIEIRNNYLEGGFDYQDTLLSEIILSGEFLEEIFRRDPATWVGSLSFYNSFEGSEEYPEEKIKIVITSDYLDNEPEYQKIKRLFTESVYDSPFGADSIYSLYLDSYTTLSNWISVDHRPQDLWWPISDNSYSYSQFLYIRDEEDGLAEDKKISLEDIHDYVTAGRIGECAFAGITFEDSTLDLITSNVSEIKSSAFEKCVTYGALRIDIPQNIILESNSLNFYFSIEILFFSGSPQDWRAFYLNQFSLALGPFSSAGKHYFSLYCNNVLLTTFGEQEFYLNKDMIIEEGVFYHVSSLRTVYLSERAQFKKDSFRVYEGLSTGIKEIYSRLTLQKWQALSYQIPAGAAAIYLYSKSKPSKEDFSSGYNFYTFEETTETEGFSLSSDKNKNMIDSKYFQVGHDGKIYAQNAEIEGTIIAKDGLIGDWVIKDGKISIAQLSDVSSNLGIIEAGIIQSPGYDLTTDTPSNSSLEATSSLVYNSTIYGSSMGLSVAGLSSNSQETNIVIPASAKDPILPGESPVLYISGGAFRYKGIQTVSIEETLEEIGGQAFAYCNLLTEVTLPSTIKKIKKEAFLYCSKLSKVFFRGTISQWKQIEIEDGNQQLLEAPLYFYNSSNDTWESLGGFKISCDKTSNMIDSSFFKVSQFGEISASQVDLTGKITATEGNIAGWKVGDICNSDHTPIGSGIYNWQETQNLSTGMAAVSGGDVVAFWAGCDKENPWQEGAKTAFYVTNEGGMVATEAFIRGHIEASSGQLGSFEFLNQGLESPYIKINPQSIYFPQNAVFNLSDKVNIYSDSTTSYIITSGEDRHFVIKNTSGAGIKFYKNPADQSSTIVVTIKNVNLRTVRKGGHGVNYYIVEMDFDYEISAPLTISYTADFTVRYYQPWITKDVASSYTFSSVDGTYGSKTITLDTDTGSGDPDFKGIKGGNNSSYTTGAITFNAQKISAKNNVLYSLGSFCPDTTSTDVNTGLYLGDTNHRWNSIVSYTSNITTSDRNQKHDIKDLALNYDGFFDGLRPVSFIYNESDSGRTHLGYIAQEVEESLIRNNIDTKDFAGICIDRDANKSGSVYALRYEEFIPLNTDQIQKLKKRVALQENRIKKLEEVIQTKFYN